MTGFRRLDGYLGAAGRDGYLSDADSSDADQRYLTGFDAPDAFVSLYTPDSLWLLVRGLEAARARTESRADEVRRPADYDVADASSTAGHLDAVEGLVDEAGVGSVATPARFPLGVADGLRGRGIDVEAVEEPIVAEIRAVKTDEEVGFIEAAQRATESAMADAEALLREASIAGGDLRHDGEALTAERVKREIETVLLEHGCGLEETIVAGGAHGADPHDRGSGPLPADEPVVIDVFPRDRRTKYHADMTRTFVRGEADPEVEARYSLTAEALEAAIGAIEPGVTGEAVHGAACDVYEAAGYGTIRSDPAAETGFIHGTGHGVGLDVHELPRLSAGGGPLEVGHVVTVEPGLYDPAVGGVRIEDLVVVTEDGARNLTDYPKRLVVA